MNEMKVIAFVGESGTGKSYHAQRVAAENGADCIIDDGLLIRGMTALAGTSAKKAKTRIASVRHALFYDEQQRETMKKAIRDAKPVGILILGTSDNMVEAIRSKLDLPPFLKTIRIEEVTTPEEMEIARHFRRDEGQHAVPIPTFELRKSFSGLVISSVKEWISDFRGGKKAVEKTVVRPSFSYMGEFKISGAVIVALCRHAAQKVPGVVRVMKVNATNETEILMDLTVNTLRPAVQTAKEAARAAIMEVEAHTGMGIRNVSCTVRDIL